MVKGQNQWSLGRVAKGANLTSSLIQLVEAGGYLLGRLSEVGLEPPFLWWTYFSLQSYQSGIPCQILISFLRIRAPVSGPVAKRFQYVFNIMQAIEECGDL